MNFAFLDTYKDFLTKDYKTYFSPGRINLIGEHIDYLGGHVFPTAISLGTYAFVSKRSDREIHLFSHNFPEKGKVIVRLDDLAYDENHGWANFVKGMFWKFKGRGYTYPYGLNILIYGNLPYASGLSSSASLEVLAGFLIKSSYGIDIDKIDIVKDAKYVENNYIGVNCGIMDQFSIGMAKENHAIYLNTETLDYEQVPLKLGDYRLLIANSNVKRALADSKYNERVKECQEAKDIINQHGFHIDALCDMNEDDLNKVLPWLKETLQKRVKHAVLENERTVQAVSLLRQGDFKSFGKSLYASHVSLRDLYEVSCLELDTLVEAFMDAGAIGSRMTGAGFGGSVIALCHKDLLEKIKNFVDETYMKKTGIQTHIYTVTPSGGPREVV